MANDGQIVFEVTADGRHAIANIKDITSQIQNETKKWDKAASDSANSINDSFSGALKGLLPALGTAAVIGALKNIGSAAIQAASDLEEVQNVVDVTFGDSAGVIDDWAKRAITQFGLTETQAKRFASTIGATLKSSGLAGKEINQISTDLAGLAADMASFYNMDFDTAFAKIRSGLSGETEPLKQLGINMSVANLEAFALSKGITKAFKDMSQGEQTMLRYQYIMQATADAQGDFARTSDGYANGLRLMESNIESIKTKLGSVLLPVISDVVSTFNDFLTKLTTTPEKTILDDFAGIDAETERKLLEIQKTADSAGALIEKLQVTSGNGIETAISGIATGANKLNAGSAKSWQNLMNAFEDTTGIKSLFGDSEVTDGVSELAKALAGDSVTTGKAQAWQTFLGSLANNAEAVSKLTGKSAEETGKWLEEMATKAALLEPDDAKGWSELMTAIVGGVDVNTKEGRDFIEQIASGYLAMGSNSKEAKDGLLALGFTEDQITQKQEAWLATCKDLVKTIPGLSEIIDTETGAVRGGIGALTDYVNEWKVSQEKIAWLKAYNKKKEALAEKQSAMQGYEIDAELAKRRYVNFIQKMNEKYGVNYEIDYENHGITGTDAWTTNPLNPEERDQMRKLHYNWENADRELERNRGALNEATEEMIALNEIAAEKMATLTDEEKKALGITDELSSSLGEEGQAALNAAQDALKALADYVDGVSKTVRSGIENSFKPFEVVQTHTQKVKDLQKELDGLKAGTKEADQYKLRIADENDIYTISKMKDGIKSQIDYLKQYNDYMTKAQSMGFSNEFLSQFADGSVESFNWLEQLVNATPAEVAELNALWAEKEEKTAALTKTLTDQKLTVDQVYNEMAEKAKEAVAALDLENEAATNSGKTVDGIIRGLGEKYEDVKEQVDSILSQIDRLASLGIDVSFLNNGLGPGGKIASGIANVPGFATGLDFVPYDNFFAKLHRGEAVLTAEENKVWQGMRAGQYDSVDYDRLGGVMSESVKAGGNVYLDGRMVGAVISDRQGREFRSLQRSGWQV
jgi:hypothetical protein